MGKCVFGQTVYRGQLVPAHAASLVAMIEAAGCRPDDAIIDVGGGASTFVDHLLQRGFRDVSVVDIAEAALAQARKRLGRRAEDLGWIVADATEWQPPRSYRLWHDRALFHFLTNPDDRKRYVAVLHEALEPGGQVILAAFSLDGPERCSGLPVRRYSADSMAEELGPGYSLEQTASEMHVTPAGHPQAFIYCRFRSC